MWEVLFFVFVVFERLFICKKGFDVFGGVFGESYCDNGCWLIVVLFLYGVEVIVGVEFLVDVFCTVVEFV